jgi:flagellar biosynthesis/type III secretory pathway protein FliH
MITRGRIIKGAFPTVIVDVDAPTALDLGNRRAARRLDGTIVNAHKEAARIVAQAQAQAEAALAEGRKKVARVAEDAATEAREREIARLAAGFLALRNEEAARAERELSQTTALAKMLAERLLGAELAQAPERVMELAVHALREARGARRAKIRAHSGDAALLAARLTDLGVQVGMKDGALEIVTDDTLTRGSLLLDTDLGVLDARLAPQLDRLTEALADVLRARA